MTANSVLPSFPTFKDVDGLPLEGGFIYIGLPNLNPEVAPKQAYFDKELTIPAAQPIRTIGGYPSRNGTPSQIYVDGEFSLTVRDKNGALIYNAATEQFLFSAEIVNFKQAGQNAVVRNVNDKLRDFATPADFGITGDVLIPTHFATLQEAIDALGPSQPEPVTLMIEAGHVLTTFVELNGGDYSRYIIKSADPEVTVVNGALDTLPDFRQNVRAVFRALKGCSFPVIDVLLNLTNYTSAGGSRNGSGMLCTEGSNMLIMPSKGCIAGYQGVIAYDGAVVNCREGIFTNAIDAAITAWSNSKVYAELADASNSEFYGVRSTEGASLVFKNGKATNCGRHAARAVAAAFLDVTSADLKNSATKGVYARHACVVMANFADCSGAGEHGFYSQRGSVITAIESTADNCPIGYEALDGSTIAAAVSSAQNCGTALISTKGSNVVLNSTPCAGSTNVALIDDNSKANLSGITCDAPATGVLVLNCSSANLRAATITNSGNSAIRAFSGSVVNADSGNFTGAAANSVYAQGASNISARNVVASNSGRGFVSEGSSMIDATGGAANGCTDGVYALGGTVTFTNGTATGCTRGLRVEGGRVVATGANLSGATFTGVFASRGSDVSLREANCRKGADDDPTDIQCLSASTVRMSQTTGGVNIALNTPSSSGLILG